MNYLLKSVIVIMIVIGLTVTAIAQISMDSKNTIEVTSVSQKIFGAYQYCVSLDKENYCYVLDSSLSAEEAKEKIRERIELDKTPKEETISTPLTVGEKFEYEIE